MMNPVEQVIGVEEPSWICGSWWEQLQLSSVLPQYHQPWSWLVPCFHIWYQLHKLLPSSLVFLLTLTPALCHVSCYNIIPDCLPHESTEKKTLPIVPLLDQYLLKREHYGQMDYPGEKWSNACSYQGMHDPENQRADMAPCCLQETDGQIRCGRCADGEWPLQSLEYWGL